MLAQADLKALRVQANMLMQACLDPFFAGVLNDFSEVLFQVIFERKAKI